MIAIIPARGGSKGLPGKNIRSLNGKPLIQYTIDAALNAKCIDRVIVTTDDIEIADIAKKAGAEIPFMRPKHLASDTASAVDVYIHAVEFIMEQKSEKIDKFIVLLPTAPLRTGKHIDEAFELMNQTKAETVIAVTKAETPPSWYMKQNSDLRLVNVGFGVSETIVKNRQENDSYFIPNGSIYILDYELLKKKRTYYSENTVGYIMDRTDSVDIDTFDDFVYAEYLMQLRGN